MEAEAEERQGGISRRRARRLLARLPVHQRGRPTAPSRGRVVQAYCSDQRVHKHIDFLRWLTVAYTCAREQDGRLT
jgi:hypothetical protein